MVEKESATVRVRVQPSASQNRVTSLQDGVAQIRIAAPAVKGKANQELIRFLSNILGVSKSNLIIAKGIVGRKKLVVIRGLGQEQVMGLLEKHID